MVGILLFVPGKDTFSRETGQLSGLLVYRPSPVQFSLRGFFTRSNLLVPLAFNTGLFQGYTERMSQSDLVVVQSYATEGEAEVAKGVLESSGIDAMIQADTAGRMREHLAWSGLGHRVLVREEDAAAARRLLALPQNDELVLLQNATEIQVEILQGALLSAGIFATVRYDGTYYQLLVNAEDAATARKVLETLPEARP
jgi:hypothetical protein